jgi:two-component system sensor histidine kinase/response regulator
MKNLDFAKLRFSKFRNPILKLIIHPKDRENRELRKKIRTLQQQLEEKSHSIDVAKSAFLKNIYHEIRTPLNVIVGFSNLLEFNSSTLKETSNYLSYIRESSQDFLQKMDEIIQASIIEAGIVKIDNSECKLCELMNEIHSYFSFHKHLINKDVAFLLTLPDEMKGTMILCDSYRLKQVIGNMLLNAFKFTRKGVVEFGFRIVREEVEFFISDTGIGGLEGKEDIVFNSFSKIDNSDTSPGGLGIGMSLASKLVKIMNGKVWFDSAVAKGTTFYFTIPYVPVLLKSESNEYQKINATAVPVAQAITDKSVVC